MSDLIRLAGVDVRAVSVGGVETCIELPGLRIAFDIGRCPATAVRHPTILFTHCHIDHMGGVLHHAALRDLQGLAPPTYYVPSTDLESFEDFMEVSRRLSHSELPCHIRPVSPGDSFPIGKQMEIRVFRSAHRVPTVGYAVVNQLQRLKAEYAGLPGYEIGRLKSQGEEITEVEARVQVAFCGDTSAGVLDGQALPREARLLILECTFLDEAVSVQWARRTGHVHLDDLLERLHLLQNERILLTHFSRRYKADQIVEILDRRLPPAERERFVPLLPGPPWGPAPVRPS